MFYLKDSPTAVPRRYTHGDMCSLFIINTADLNIWLGCRTCTIFNVCTALVTGKHRLRLRTAQYVDMYTCLRSGTAQPKHVYLRFRYARYADEHSPSCQAYPSTKYSGIGMNKNENSMRTYRVSFTKPEVDLRYYHTLGTTSDTYLLVQVTSDTNVRQLPNPNPVGTFCTPS